MKKAFNILNNNSGITLLLVLGVTLLLTAISTSALIAATTAAGAVKAKSEYKRVDFLAESIVNTFYASLNEQDNAVSSPTLGADNGIGKELVNYVFIETHKNPTTAAIAPPYIASPKDLTITIPNVLDTIPTDGTGYALISPQTAAFETDITTTQAADIANDRSQKEQQYINLTLQFTVQYQPPNGKLVSVKYSAVFQNTSILSEGTFSDTGTIKKALEISDINNYGSWTLKSYEKIKDTPVTTP